MGKTVGATMAVSFWGEINLWPSPNLPTLVAAFGIAFLACCATVVVSDVIQARRTGVPSWDHIKRSTPRWRLWTHIALSATLAAACGIIGALVALLPVLPVIAAGVVPLAALKLLSGGTLEDKKQAGDNPDAQDR